MRLDSRFSVVKDPMNQVALAMGAFTTEARESRRIAQDNRTADKHPKVSAERWKSMFPTLLKLCMVGDQYLIPPLYTGISKGYKGEELPAFQSDLDRIAYVNITYNQEPPVV